jgi:transposase InsO family protein
LGAVLLQEQDDGRQSVIAYASRGLRSSERNYPAHKLEFLALKWAITDKFHDYLYGNSFTVYTDNNPLTYVLSSAKLDATGHRWVAALSSYDFDICYKPGSTNADCDGLSRQPRLFSEAVKAVCLAATASVSCSEILPGDPEIPDVTEFVPMNSVNWASEQSKDPDLSKVISILRSGSRPRGGDLPREVKSLLRDYSSLVLDNDVLYRTASVDGEKVRQLIIPSSFRSVAFRGVHDDVGHPGFEKSIWLARQRFFWPGMETYFRQRISLCLSCVCRKTPVVPRAELVPIQTTRPMQIVCIDFLKLEKSKGGYEDVLVITDHFTRYAKAVPCRNQKASTTAKALFDHFIVHYSFPEQLHSDQGRNFESRVIKELCKLANVRKTRTTPFHPMGNPSAERFNRTLLRMLGTLAEDHKANWKDYLPSLVLAYNATKSSSTGFSPHFLMFGWHPRLSVDAFLGTSPSDQQDSQHSYAAKLRDRMQYAYRVAGEAARKRADQNKVNYDQKVRENKLVVGDTVLVRNVNLQGRQKLAARWERDPYMVVAIPYEGQPVFQVRRESGNGPIRTLHRNMLLPFTSIPEDEVVSVAQPLPKATIRSKSNRVLETVDSEVSDSDTSSSSSGVYVIPQRRHQRSIPNLPARINTPSAVSTPVSSVRPVSNLSQPGATPLQDSRHFTPVTTPSPSLNLSVPTPGSTPVTPIPVPRPRRTVRPPQRYGEWVSQQSAEFFV